MWVGDVVGKVDETFVHQAPAWNVEAEVAGGPADVSRDCAL